MENSNLIFISHKSQDDALVSELHDILLEIDPSLKGKVYFDHRPDLPLEKADSWCPSILKEVDNSKYLIFITSNLKHLREGGGWLYEEVSQFQKLKASRHANNRSELNISYFGIFLCDCDFETDIFSDPVMGSEYRKLYQSPEHLVLGNGATFSGAKDRIRNKIIALLSDGGASETSALIIDKVRAFAEGKRQTDYMFDPSIIDERLMPLIKAPSKKQVDTKPTENVFEADTDITEASSASSKRGSSSSSKNADGSSDLCFAELCERVKETNISLVGYEGGCGKTTILTKLFYEFLKKADSSDNNSLIPIYVDAKSLAGENHLILRHLSKVLFDEYTATTDKTTGKSAGMLDYEFSLKTPGPRYLLIIDGYNEIPESVLPQFKREMLEFQPGGRYSNVRVMISGRHIDLNLPDEIFEHHKVKPLDYSQIKTYLSELGLWHDGTSKSMLSILSIPMYLRMYAETVTSDTIQNKSDLLNAFINRQLTKDGASAESDSTKALYSVFLTHILPIIAHRMITNGTGGSTFLLSTTELEDTLAYASELLQKTAYKRLCGEEYRRLLRDSAFSSYDELDLSDLAKIYFVRVCKMLRSDSDGRLDFVHQIYRDFFCAKFVSEQMKYSLKADSPSDALSKQIFDADIISFVSELLSEGAPRLDGDGCWDYSCNADSVTVPFISLYRDVTGPDAATSVANAAEILKYARSGDLSGLDLSHLDLTKCSLATCHLSRFDNRGVHPTSFSYSIIERYNVFTEKHFEEILAACTNETTVACIDSTGVIKIWEKSNNAAFPVKIISDVRYSVKKLLFSKDGLSLFAMTDHEIFEIPIPEEFSSVAEPRLAFETPSHLADFRIDSDGRILFSTILNSFNYKHTDSPDEPDEHKFLCINSAACMLPSKKRLAFGHVIGYDALKIYDYSEENDLWTERKFGYSKILNDFILELEELFKGFKLYHLFPTDNKLRDEHKTFFSYTKQQFEDSTHDHKRIPEHILKRCVSEVEKTVSLYNWQKKKLEEIARKYELIFEEAEKENYLLMLLPGRKITSISAKDGSDVILVSAAIDYQDKLKIKVDKSRRFKSTVMEINTETFETRYIMNFIANTPLYAAYCGDDIVIRSKYHVTVYDSTVNDICHVTTCPKPLNSLVPCTDNASFYILSAHFIYKMDKNMKCQKSINNVFGNTSVCIVEDESGKALAVQKKPFADANGLIKAIDLSSGAECKYLLADLEQCERYAPNKTVTLGDVSYKSCSENLVAFKNMIKCNEYDVPYKLFVNGCDFTGVSGSIANPRYLRMLDCMGAETDAFEVPAVPKPNESCEEFVRSTAELVTPDIDPNWRSPYAFRPEMNLKEECFLSNMTGGNNLYLQKTWNLINRDFFYSGNLGQADYSILEWIDNFSFCTTDMISDLIEAGIIPTPARFSHVDKRMLGSLHKTYKFAFRSRFFDAEESTPTAIFSVYFPFGAKLLYHITGKMPKNHLLTRDTKRAAHQNRIPDKDHDLIVINDQELLREICRKLILNHWFAVSARRYKDIIKDYSLGSTFDTDSHFSGRATVHGYLELGDRPVFAQAFRGVSGDKLFKDAVNKVLRLCLLSTYYQSLTRYEKQLNKLKRQPIIVIICEGLDACKELNSRIEHIYPGVRKLFTFDSLLMSEEAFTGAGNYFEFTNGVPHSLKLEDVL